MEEQPRDEQPKPNDETEQAHHIDDRRKKAGQLLIGFALETDDEACNAVLKLRKKNLDLIVLNSLRDKGAGFGGDTNKVTVIDRKEQQFAYDLKSKQEVATDIVDRIVDLLQVK